MKIIIQELSEIEDIITKRDDAKQCGNAWFRLQEIIHKELSVHQLINVISIFQNEDIRQLAALRLKHSRR